MKRLLMMTRLQQICARLLLATVYLITSTQIHASINIIPESPTISAKAFILMDYGSGRILAQHNANERLLPASLTKMMTSYVIGQELKSGQINDDDLVTVSNNAWAKNFPDSSKMFIEVGKKVKVADLNKGIIVQSGNDACVAMAEHIAGSEKGFVSIMNAWAKQLGMENTSFENSHGLDTTKHYTTAYDMAVLARALIRDVPKEYQLYAEKKFTYNGITQYNRNTLLWDNHLRVDGIKTGHTSGAGYSLVTSSMKNGMRLIAVVMGAKSESARARESKKILKYGFRYFESVTPYKAGDSFVSHRVYYGNKSTVQLGVNQDTPFSVYQGQAKALKANFELTKELKAPLEKGQVVGKIYFQVDGKDIANFPLVTLEEVKEGTIFHKLTDYLRQVIERVMAE